MFDWIFGANWDSSILNVKWFSLTYFIILLLMASTIVLLYFLFRKKSKKSIMTLLWCLYFVALANKILNLVFWFTPLSANYQNVTSPDGVVKFANYLLLDSSSTHFNVARWIYGAFPWSLCGLNIYFIPIYLKSKKPFWKQFGFSTLMLGAFFGIILSVNFAWPNPWIFFDYYYNHFVFFAIPLLMVLLGVFKPKYRLVGSSFVLLLSLLVGVFILSMIFNWTLNPEYLSLNENTWYFNSVWTVKGDTIPFNFIYNLIPIPLLYMALFLPIIFIFWFLIILPFDKIEEIKYLPKDFISFFSRKKEINNNQDNES
ncbi:MAG: hypothetical protein LBV58_02560 [Acholeplasmatales bacterium]|jgi:hypothetical protein|nr:hypothetical protein [Acholeplasmatales bacterium]